MERKAKIAKAIRIISVPPVMVTMLILILVFYKAEIFRSFSESMILIILLGIVPVSAYGLQLILPNYKKSGREGQRKLAFITSLIGYSAAFIWAIFTDVKDSLLLICSTYFFSVVLLSISNKVIHFRASGHACSFAGPLVLLVHFFSWMMAIPCILMAVIIAWSSIYLKRHTIKELAGGIVTCLLAYGLSIGFVMVIN